MVQVQATGRDGVSRRVRRVSPIQNRRYAEKLEHRIRVELLDADGCDRSQAPLYSDYAPRFLVYATTNNRPSEVASKEAILRRHLVPAFGLLRLDQIRATDIEEFKARKLAERFAPSTIVNFLTVLRKSLTVAREWGLLDAVPAIRWLKREPCDMDFLSLEEVDRLIAAADQEWRTMITIAATTGLRRGELRALRWRDVDLEVPQLLVQRAAWKDHVSSPKSGRARLVPLCERARNAFRAHPHRCDLVFPDPRGAMLGVNAMRSPLRHATRRAGLRPIGWHTLRHSFASNLVMRRAPLKAVQELLGHATLEMTLRYAHLGPGLKREVVCLLDGA
jgi:integrase